MIKVVKGNVVDAVLSGECDLMLHITNGQRVMGSGVAKQVKERIPSAYTNYLKSPKNEPDISFSDCLRVCNLTSQQYYGYDGKRYLKYNWLVENLIFLYDDFIWDLVEHFNKPTLKIAIPYKMGSDRAGGDWDTVCEILEGFLGDHEIIAYKL